MLTSDSSEEIQFPLTGIINQLSPSTVEHVMGLLLSKTQNIMSEEVPSGTVNRLTDVLQNFDMTKLLEEVNKVDETPIMHKRSPKKVLMTYNYEDSISKEKSLFGDKTTYVYYFPFKVEENKITFEVITTGSAGARVEKIEGECVFVRWYCDLLSTVKWKLTVIGLDPDNNTEH